LGRIDVPVEVVVGDRDPVKRMYVGPLRLARKDWPVVEIDGAGHIDCILKKPFRDEVARWVRAHAKR
jgi:pimeloyl-ACP methyl ester carboxylesterase